MKTVEVTYRYGMPGELPLPRPTDAESAKRRLNEGNSAFAALFDLAEGSGAARRVVDVDARDLGGWGPDTGVAKQRPFAVVLGCSDARVPIELVFNEGPNDLFVIRVAGNSLGDDVLGSLRYAIDHLKESLRLIVVLGHSGCGPLSAAVDAFLDPSGYLPLATSHSLRAIVDRQFIVVQAAARKLASMFGNEVVGHAQYREALIEAAIVTNAALAAHAIERELRALGPNDIRALFGVYLLQSRQIWAPRAGGGPNGLAEPPTTVSAFAELADLIVQSDRIASLLARQPH